MDVLPAKSEHQGGSITVLDELDPESFDWKAYCSTYKGRALITRLLFIPNLILSEPSNVSANALAVAWAAAAQAIPLLKQTWDIEGYLSAVDMVARCLAHPAAAAGEAMEVDSAAAAAPPVSAGEYPETRTGVPDQAWVAQTRAAAQAEGARLAVELNGYSSNLIKESIRLTYLAMSQLALKNGSLVNALKSFQQVREYSSGAAHHVELGLGIINAALMFNESVPLAGNIPKVEAMVDRLYPVAPSAPISSTMTTAQVQQNREAEARNQALRRAVGVKLRVARAVLALSHSEYQKAARELGEVGEEGGLEDWEGEAMSTPDVAFLSAICTLATGSREHIRRVLLDRASFHSALGDHQGWVMDLVRAFVDARYGDAIKLLRNAEVFMVLNPWLSEHTPELLRMVRMRGIKQYLAPFASVRVSAMATAFGIDEDTMLAEVCTLTESGALPVRIDLVDRVLRIKERDERAAAFTGALEQGTAITRTAAGNVFRMRLKEAGVTVEAGPREGKRKDMDWGALRSRKGVA